MTSQVCTLPLKGEIIPTFHAQLNIIMPRQSGQRISSSTTIVQLLPIKSNSFYLTILCHSHCCYKSSYLSWWVCGLVCLVKSGSRVGNHVSTSEPSLQFAQWPITPLKFIYMYINQSLDLHHTTQQTKLPDEQQMILLPFGRRLPTSYLSGSIDPLWFSTLETCPPLKQTPTTFKTRLHNNYTKYWIAYH